VKNAQPSSLLETLNIITTENALWEAQRNLATALSCVQRAMTLLQEVEQQSSLNRLGKEPNILAFVKHLKRSRLGNKAGGKRSSQVR
jgi:hypothetical protein